MGDSGLTNSSACNNYPSLSFPLFYVVGNRKEQTWKAQAVLLKLYMEPEIFSTLTLLLCQLWKKAWVASRCGQLQKIFSGILILTHCRACSIEVLTCTGWLRRLTSQLCSLVTHRSSTEESSSGSDCSLSGETHKKPVLTSAALLRYHQWPLYNNLLYIFHGYTLL